MRIKVLVIPFDPDEVIHTVFAEADDPTAAGFRSLIGGGPLEAVNLYQPDAVMWVDEDGKSKTFPINLRATLIAHDRGPMAVDDMIVGDVFITGPTNPSGHSTAVPEFYVEALAGV